MSAGHRSLPYTLVFFDGVCGLCNGFVDFLIRRDGARALRFAPLQGSTAARFDQLPRGLDSVVVVDGHRVLVKSDAALCALSRLGGAWRLWTVARIVPRRVRDAVYDVIAQNRYAWFGRREACRIPTPDDSLWLLE
jgi:predicted DCC family thiol-disulfide oxidoreductase YuxK